jgi:hypothetical protein
MFQLSLVDHIRLSFSHVFHASHAHAEAAERLARRARQARIAVLAVLGLAACAAVAALFQGRPVQIAAAALVGLGYGLYAVVVVLDFEPRVAAHRAAASSLWLLADRYCALLGDVQDGAIEPSAAAERRDALMREVQAVFELAPAGDRNTIAQARRALSAKDGLYSDEEIDRILPPSLRRGHTAA